MQESLILIFPMEVPTVPILHVCKDMLHPKFKWLEIIWAIKTYKINKIYLIEKWLFRKFIVILSYFYSLLKQNKRYE